MAHDLSQARLEFHWHAWNFPHARCPPPFWSGFGVGVLVFGVGSGGLGLVLGVEVGPKPRCWLEERILKDMSVFLDDVECLRVGFALI